jgi:hypothetical protein
VDPKPPKQINMLFPLSCSYICCDLFEINFHSSTLTSVICSVPFSERKEPHLIVFAICAPLGPLLTEGFKPNHAKHHASFDLLFLRPMVTLLGRHYTILLNQVTQKLILLSRGKAISGAPNNMGTNQFPKPPIRIGITIKNIIKKACAVIITL